MTLGKGACQIVRDDQAEAMTGYRWRRWPDSTW
jgi:hypothetical protein